MKNLFLFAPYIIFYIFFIILIFKKLNSSHEKKFVLFLWFILLIFIGLRHEIGGDWPIYLKRFYEYKSQSFYELFFQLEPGYPIINKIFSFWEKGYYLVNLFCAFFALFGLYKISGHFTSPYLSLVMAFPYYLTIVSMGYTRQSVAIGCLLLVLDSLLLNKYYRSLVYGLITLSFHTPSLLPLSLVTFFVILSKKKFKALFLCLGILFFSLLMIKDHLLSRGQDYLGRHGFQKQSVSNQEVTPPPSTHSHGLESQNRPPPLPSHLPSINSSQNHISTKTSTPSEPTIRYTSQGAQPRLLMLVFICFLLFFFRGHFFKNKDEFLTWLGLLILPFVLYPLSFYFSTLADRLGLYSLPVTFLFAGNLIKTSKYKNLLKLSLFLFSLSYLILWLSMSHYAKIAWLPYDNLLFKFLPL